MNSGHPRVLVIADEKSLPGLIRPLLEESGYDIGVATDSRLAARLFLRTPRRFDVVVVDDSMPRVLGTTLAEGILRVRPDIPLVLYSDAIPARHPEGADNHVVVLPKSSGAHLLISTINRLLPGPPVLTEGISLNRKGC